MFFNYQNSYFLAFVSPLTNICLWPQIQPVCHNTIFKLSYLLPSQVCYCHTGKKNIKAIWKHSHSGQISFLTNAEGVWRSHVQHRRSENIQKRYQFLTDDTLMTRNIIWRTFCLLFFISQVSTKDEFQDPTVFLFFFLHTNNVTVLLLNKPNEKLSHISYVKFNMHSDNVWSSVSPVRTDIDVLLVWEEVTSQGTAFWVNVIPPTVSPVCLQVHHIHLFFLLPDKWNKSPE